MVLLAMKIWVIDDDRDIRDALAECLGEEGHEVASFDDGSLALARLAAGERTDLIFLDMLMPGMPGQAFLKALGHEASWDSIPVVVISGMACSDHQRVATVLRKPFNLKKLFDTVLQFTPPLILATATSATAAVASDLVV